MSNIFEAELQALKTYDEVQFSTDYKGYKFITTASHGYLVVPFTDKYYKQALDICNYGFIGRHAVYLEEDCEAMEFINSLQAVIA